MPPPSQGWGCEATQGLQIGLPLSFLFIAKDCETPTKRIPWVDMAALGIALFGYGGKGRVPEKWDSLCGGGGWARPTVHSDLAGALSLAGAILG